MNRDMPNVTALIAKWRETAKIWEDQELGRGAYHGSPVGNGRGNIKNWINWLRSCACDVEAAIKADVANGQSSADRRGT